MNKAVSLVPVNNKKEAPKRFEQSEDFVGPKQPLKQLKTTWWVRRDNLLDNPKSHDSLVKQIKWAVENIEKKAESTSTLRAIHKAIGEVTEKSLSLHEVKLGSPTYHNLTNYSKKKFLAHKLKERFPDKEERKKIVSDALYLHSSDEGFADMIRDIWKDPLLWYVAEVFFNNDTVSWLQLDGAFDHDMSPEFQDMFINSITAAGANPSLINRYKERKGWYDESTFIWNNKNKVAENKTIESLLQVNTVDREGSSDFNPLVYDLNLELWTKIFSLARFKEIYQQFFFQVVSNIISQTWGKLPSYNHLNTVLAGQIKKECAEAEREKQFYQYTIEWDIPEDIWKTELKEIVAMYNEHEDTLNPNSTPHNELFQHPIKTLPGIQKFFWHFRNGWTDFSSESIIIIEDQKTDQRKLRITLNDLDQDQYTYIISQISFFIENKSFINKQQLFYNIYNNYNQEVYKNDTDYDISIFEEQYSRFMQNIIIPLSREWADLGLKAQNMLLAGIYGGWKSKFLLSLLKRKEFQINDKTFNLNANVIPIDLQTFKAMLWAPFGGLKTKLDSIYQNTKLPIILVVEDIDTLIYEKKHNTNDEIAQAMTLLLEWIWSIPVTIVTTANEPSKLSERLIRPNRIYEIVEFYLPTTEQKYKLLDTHLNEKWISISDDLRDKLMKTKVFEKWTASHIWNFCAQLRSKEKMEHIIWNTDYKLNEEEILHIANNVNISSSDIEKVIKETQEWYKEVTGNESKWWIGFTAQLN